jgi:prepilin-type N-terminal cleavage/methylation domain-containing protein
LIQNLVDADKQSEEIAKFDKLLNDEKKCLSWNKETQNKVQSDCETFTLHWRGCHKVTGEGNKKAAFTLAEVLITLGIIGIVAAMTIPTLQTAYKAHKLRTQFMKIYSTLSQAILTAEDESGLTYLYTDIRLNVTGITKCDNGATMRDGEGNDACFHSKNGLYKTINGTSIPAARMDDGYPFKFSNGANIMYEWDDKNYKDGTHHWIWADINGYNNPPNQLGVDLFVFQIIDDKFLAFGDKGSKVGSMEITPDEYCDPKTTSTSNFMGFGCTNKAKNNQDYFKWALKNIK